MKTMSRWYRIISPGDERQHWHGDRRPEQDEIDEIVDGWESGLEPMDIPQLVTDYLLVQRHRVWGWQTIQTVHLVDMLNPKNPE